MKRPHLLSEVSAQAARNNASFDWSRCKLSATPADDHQSKLSIIFGAPMKRPQCGYPGVGVSEIDRPKKSK